MILGKILYSVRTNWCRNFIKMLFLNKIVDTSTISTLKLNKSNYQSWKYKIEFRNVVGEELPVVVDPSTEWKESKSFDQASFECFFKLL